MMFMGVEMDNQKEREAFVKWFESRYIDDIHPDSTIGIASWEAWKEAKAQAVPDGFVLVPKEMPKSFDEGLYVYSNSISIVDECSEGFIPMSDINHAEVWKLVIEVQESAPLKLGDLVEPIDHRYTLASGCERYPYAYVVNTNPFQLMSEEGDMYWCCTVEAGGYKLIKSNDQLPEAVSLRMIREGLLAPVEAQEQSHENG